MPQIAIIIILNLNFILTCEACIVTHGHSVKKTLPRGPIMHHSLARSQTVKRTNPLCESLATRCTGTEQIVFAAACLV